MCKRDAEKQSSTNFIRRIVHEMHEFYGLFLGILQELHHVTLFVTDLVHCKPLTTNVGVKGLNSLATDEIAFHWRELQTRKLWVPVHVVWPRVHGSMQCRCDWFTFHL